MLAIKKLKYSASEMCIFSINFAALIGDLVPQNDTLWTLYILLRKILPIAMSEIVSDKMSNLLVDLVRTHHETYYENFSNLIPKFHLMVHYLGILKSVGFFKISIKRYLVHAI